MKRVCKRIVDAAGAAIGLTIATPLLIVVFVAVRLSMGRPVLFRQRRAGHNGRLFWLHKFRTMTTATNPDGSLLPDGERLTRLGRFLRRTSFDELPELWNVLRGEMSLVGPRPLLAEYLPRYSDFQRRRLEVKPGLTGWAQIHGRNAISWEQRFNLDVWYVDHRSLWLDFRILARTVELVLCGHGIEFQEGTPMAEFLGSGAVQR